MLHRNPTKVRLDWLLFGPARVLSCCDMGSLSRRTWRRCPFFRLCCARARSHWDLVHSTQRGVCREEFLTRAHAGGGICYGSYRPVLPGSEWVLVQGGVISCLGSRPVLFVLFSLVVLLCGCGCAGFRSSNGQRPFFCRGFRFGSRSSCYV